MILKVKKLTDSAIAPNHSHPGDAGLDLYSAESVVLQPRAIGLIKTGIAIELPKGTEAQVRPRSGLALKNGLTVLNSPGTIDEGYRGEVGVILINHSEQPFVVNSGMKIAQLVIKPVFSVEVLEVAELSNTARGAGGFGSTGH